MAVCKGILDGARRVAEALSLSISDKVVEAIAVRNETLLQEVLCEASNACACSRRKVVSKDDVRKAVEPKGLPFFSILFE